MKRTLSLFLTVLLLLSACFSGSVYADINPDYKPPEKPKEEYSYSIENSEVVLKYYCSYSAEFKIPETMEGYPVTKVEFVGSFVDDVMKTIYIPKTVRDVGAYINYGNRGLQAIVVDEENPYYSSVDGVLYNKDKTTLIQYPAAKKGPVTFAPTLQAIGERAFYQCSGVTAVTIPEGITTIEKSAFYYCSALASVVLPNSLEYIANGAFCGCNSLRTIQIPAGVKSIGSYAFESCQNLQSVEFPDGLTHIGSQAFFDCPKLSSVILPKGLVEIGIEAFGYIDYSTMCCIYYEPNPDFTIYGWKNTVAEAYANGAGSQDYMRHYYPFVPLDYFTNPDHPPVTGDVDADRSCSAADALQVLKFVVGKLQFHESQLTAADLDDDGKFSATDALNILKIVVGKIELDEPFIPIEIDQSSEYASDSVLVVIKKKYGGVNKIWTADDFPQLGNTTNPSLLQIERIEDLTWADTPEAIEKQQNNPKFHQILKIHLINYYERDGIAEAIRLLSQNGYLVLAEPDYYLPLDNN